MASPLPSSGASASSPRIAPGGLRALGPVGWLAARLGARFAGTEDVHLFSTLGRVKRLFPAWLGYSVMMMPFGALPRKETELTILRVAHLQKSLYEQSHHQRIAERMGISSSQINATVGPLEEYDWPQRMLAILAATDAVVGTGDLSDAHWHNLRTHLTEKECIALLQLIAQYSGLATVLRVLRVQLDQPR